MRLMLVGVLLAGATGLVAQTSWAAGAQAAPDAAASAAPGKSPMTDDAFVRRAGVANLYEIEAGKIAEQRGQSAAVKALGELMVKDHTKVAGEMSRVLKVAGVKVAMPDHLGARYQALIDKLQAADAAGFDEVYLQQQIKIHVRALKLLKAYAANGDNPVLKQLAAEAAPIIKHHLDEVRRIEGGLKSAT